MLMERGYKQCRTTGKNSSELTGYQTGGRHEKERGKGKIEKSKLRVNRLRETKELRTLSLSLLMKQSKRDCSRRESTYVA